MKNEFKVKKYKDATVYTLESATSGGTSAGSIASVSNAMGGVRRRGDNLIAQEEKKEAPKPRNFVAKNAKMGGAGQHKDKKKAQKQGQEKHKKPYAEDLKQRLDILKQKINENSDLAAQLMATARSLGMNPRLRGTPDQERERTQQMMAQRAKERDAASAQAASDDAKNLPQLKAEYEEMKKKYEALGGSNWQYADREQNLSSAEREARSMEPALRNLSAKIARAEKAGVAEGLPQTLRKVVPGYAKREIDKKMDAGKFGKTDADKDANFQRYKKIQDKIKEQGVAEMDSQGYTGSRDRKRTSKYGSRDDYELGGPESTGRPLTAKQMMDRAHKAMLKSMSNDEKVDKGWRNPNIDEGSDYFEHLDNLLEDWQKVNKKDKTDGMSRKAVKAYRRENPGSKLKTAVTTKPSKLKKGGKAAKRRKSFCARMKGMKKAHAGAKTKRNPDSPINKALRRWNCEEDAYMNSLNAQVLEKLNPQAPVDTWVQDFQKADPNKYKQFKNKTPQKKAQMAAAAHYAANEPSKKK